MKFKKFDETKNGSRLFYCAYNDSFHVYMVWTILNEKKFHIIQIQKNEEMHELYKVFSNAKDVKKEINLLMEL